MTPAATSPMPIQTFVSRCWLYTKLEIKLTVKIANPAHKECTTPTGISFMAWLKNKNAAKWPEITSKAGTGLDKLNPSVALSAT